MNAVNAVNAVPLCAAGLEAWSVDLSQGRAGDAEVEWHAEVAGFALRVSQDIINMYLSHFITNQDKRLPQIIWKTANAPKGRLSFDTYLNDILLACVYYACHHSR